MTESDSNLYKPIFYRSLPRLVGGISFIIARKKLTEHY